MTHLAFGIVVLIVFFMILAIPSWLVGVFFPLLSKLPLFACIPCMVMVFMCGFILGVGILSTIVPKPKPGKYPFPKHPQVALWAFHFSVQRIAMFQLWRNFYMSFSVLKYLYLKSLGANIHFESWTSSNIELSEAYLVTVKKGALLGSRAEVGCHFIRDGVLILAASTVEEDAQVLLNAIIGPHCTLGKKSVLGIDSKIVYKVTIGEGTVIGNRCYIQSLVNIGDNVKIGDLVTIESAVTIDSGVTIPNGTWIRRGVRVTKETQFEDGRWQTLERRPKGEGGLGERGNRRPPSRIEARG